MDLMKLKDAAKRVNVEPITLRRAIKAGELEAVDLGRGYQVTEQALQAYIVRKTVNVGGNTDNADRITGLSKSNS